MPRWQAPGAAPSEDPSAGGLLGELTARPLRLGVAAAATVAAVALVGAAPGSAAGGGPARQVAPRAPGPPHTGTASDVATMVSSARVCPGLDWRVLLAMYEVESDRGAIAGRSSAGAMGPMQFMPDTWRQYQSDGDGDGRSNVTVLSDAAAAAARMLCANGAGRPGGLHDALWSYNHSDDYVSRVMSAAVGMGAR